MTLMRAAHKVVDPRGRLIRFNPRPEQTQLALAINQQRAMGLPVRILVLKARKVGVSTYIQHRYCQHALLQARRRSFSLAHTAVATANLYRMASIWRGALPGRLQRPTERSGLREVVFAEPHASSLAYQTAGAQEVARSDTIHDVHGSEVAFWTRAKQALTSLLNAVPDERGTEVVLESTANGMGGPFHARWIQAIDAQRKGEPHGWWPIFFSWLGHAAYTREIPQGHDLRPYDDIEQGLRARGASDEQLWWRRCLLAERFAGDVELFAQEYPSTWQEAFLVTGRQVIPADIRAQHEIWVQESDWRGAYVGADCAWHYSSHEYREKQAWRIFEEPQPGHHYIIGADVAEGKSSDRGDERSDPDYSAAAVLDRGRRRIVATCRRRTAPDVWGEELVRAARAYHNAILAPEINNPGWSTISACQGYPNLWCEALSDPTRVEVEVDLRDYGWRTTAANRRWMADQYVAACRRPPGGTWHGTLHVPCERLVSEESTWVYDQSGRPDHLPGTHDDLLIAAMIAWQVHLMAPAPVSREVQEAEKRRRRALRAATDIGTLARTDAVDPGL